MKLMKEFFKENKEVILPAALFLIVLILFGRMVFNGFAYDDIFLVINNPVIKTVVNPFYYFSQAKTLEFIGIPDVYRPLGAWFFALEYRLFGLDPFYFHLISLFLHAANVILLFFLLKKILSAEGAAPAGGQGSAVRLSSPSKSSGGKNLILSFVGSLIFAVHPATPETVAWAIQQYSLWSWFFCFLALHLLFTEKSNDNLILNKKWKKITLLVIFSFAAVFLKEHAVILPLIYILCVLAFKMGIRKKLGEIVAVTLPVILYLVLRGVVLGAYSQMEPWGSGRYIMFLTMLKGFVYYFRLMVWPHPLSITYDLFFFTESLKEFTVIASAIFLFLIILAAIFFWRKRPLFSLGVFWIFIVMLPVSNFIFPTKQIISERYLYFMLPGFILAVSAIAIFINEKITKFKKFLAPLSVFLVVAVFLIFGWLTFVRLADWKNDLALWRHEIQFNSNSWKTLSNYGMALEKENRTKEAIEYYKKAGMPISLEGEVVKPCPSIKIISVDKLARAYFRMGKFKEAEILLLDALRTLKNSPDNKYNEYLLSVLYYQLGQTYLEEKEYMKAKEAFENLAANYDNSDTSLFFIMLSEKLNGGTDEKIKTGIKKIKNQNFREAAFPIIKGKQKMLENKYGEAIAFFGEALDGRTIPITNPYLWLGQCFEKIGQRKEALEIYRLILTSVFYSIDAVQGVLRNGGTEDEALLPYL